MLKQVNVDDIIGSDTIVYDALGGEKGLEEMMEGIFTAAAICPEKIVVVGKYYECDKAIQNIHKKRSLEKIAPWLYTKSFDKIISNIYVIDSQEKASAESNPRKIMKNKEFSINKAMDFAKNNKSLGVISPGSTGDTVLSATHHFKRMSFGEAGKVKLIGSPPLATPIANDYGYCVVLDLGANTDCSAKQLLQFAYLGSAFYKVLFGQEPYVGLLNNGTEPGKGDSLRKEAEKMFLEAAIEKMINLKPINQNKYQINYEPKHVYEKDPQVMVAGGFEGNLWLKSVETGARMVGKNVKKQSKKMWNLPASLYLNLVGFYGRVFNQMKDSYYGGAVCLGLDEDIQIVVSHGQVDRKGVASSIMSVSRNKGVIKKFHDEVKKKHK